MIEKSYKGQGILGMQIRTLVDPGSPMEQYTSLYYRLLPAIATANLT